MFIVNNPSNGEIKEVVNKKLEAEEHTRKKKESILFPIFKLLNNLQIIDLDFYKKKLFGDFYRGLILTNHVIEKHWFDNEYRFLYLGDNKRKRKKILNNSIKPRIDLRINFEREYLTSFHYRMSYIPEENYINLNAVLLIQQSLDELSEILKEKIEEKKYESDKEIAETNLLMDKVSFTINT